MTDTTGWLIDTTGWLTTPGDWQQHGVTDTTGWLINTAGWLSATTRWLTDTSGWLQELSQERKFHWGGFTWLLMLSQHACSSGTAITSLNNGYYLSKEFFDPCVDLCGWLHICFLDDCVCLCEYFSLHGWMIVFLYIWWCLFPKVCVWWNSFDCCRLFVFLSAISGHSNAGENIVFLLCKADSFDLEYLLLLFTIAYVSFLLLVYVLHVTFMWLC